MTARVYGRWMPDTDTGAGGGPSRCTPGHQASYCPDPREKLQLKKTKARSCGPLFCSLSKSRKPCWHYVVIPEPNQPQNTPINDNLTSIIP